MLLQRSSRHIFLLVALLATITIFLYYHKLSIHQLISSSLTPTPLTSTPPTEDTNGPTGPSTKPANNLDENGNGNGNGKGKEVKIEGAGGIGNLTKTFVVSSQKKDNTTWIDRLLPDWEYVRYLTDEPNGRFRVPLNKGNEAMVYLTYIIDHYDNLPDLMVFIHSERFQWHNDDPLWDNAYLLSNLQIPHLLSQPYTNLRCVWTLGCPSDIKGINQPIPPYLDPNDEHLRKHLSLQYAIAFPILFPTDPIPVHVSVPCCAQFATLSSSVRARPKSQYVAIRKWLIDTKLENDISGRIMEFSWHVMFGAEAFACPHAGRCYCELYGLCGDEVVAGAGGGIGEGKERVMKGCGKESCEGRWDWPPGRDWPKGWPEEGWNGEMRSAEDLEALRKLGKADKPEEKEEKKDR